MTNCVWTYERNNDESNSKCMIKEMYHIHKQEENYNGDRVKRVGKINYSTGCWTSSLS